MAVPPLTSNLPLLLTTRFVAAAVTPLIQAASASEPLAVLTTTLPELSMVPAPVRKLPSTPTPSTAAPALAVTLMDPELIIDTLRPAPATPSMLLAPLGDELVTVMMPLLVTLAAPWPANTPAADRERPLANVAVTSTVIEAPVSFRKLPLVQLLPVT
ncbi:Uncharacterised protein [Xylophilus ampelinus]|nr:Uncharacterised protein [Xylophilus ampelinus]